MLSCFATAVRGDVLLQLARNEREKLRRSTVILSSTCEVLKECDHEDVAEFVLATSDDARVMDGRKVRGGFHCMWVFV